MKKVKKTLPSIIFSIFIALIAISRLTGCSTNDSPEGYSQRDVGDKITVVDSDETPSPSPSLGSQSDSSSYDDLDDWDEDEDEDKPETYKYKARLTCGFYYTGYHIPEGTYNLKLISGSGNVFSNELNEIFGNNKKYGHIKKYNNLDLTGLDCLQINGSLVLEISSKNAIKSKPDAENKAKKSYTFSSGKYKCKKHINTGMYDITLVSGSGNVFVGDSVNEIFGTDSSWSHIKKVKNVAIGKGDEIEISGCTVKFSPSKIKYEKNLFK